MEIKDSKLQRTYCFSDREKLREVSEKREDVANKIDLDDNFFLSDPEITTYLEKSLILKKGTTPENKEKIVADFKLALEDKGKEIRDLYPSYEGVVNDLKALETKYPNLAKVVKLNDKPTAEGRDILALKISKDVQGDTSNKPGVVITGIHHAREWATVEASRNTAHELLENYDKDDKAKKRVDNAEIWIVPLANPDGYAYSRNEYRYWRKDREKVEKDGNVTIGIDANRNYWDGKPEDYVLYRPKDDTPEVVWEDDLGASDEPDADDFRGLTPNSSPGVKALVGLELGLKNLKGKVIYGKNERPIEETPTNIKGVLDYHSYGNSILIPLGISPDPVPKEDLYKDLCEGLVKVMPTKFDITKSYDMYPSSGSSDVIDAAGPIELTLEIGNYFFPEKDDLEIIKKDASAANNYFIDWIINRYGSKEKDSDTIKNMAAGS